MDAKSAFFLKAFLLCVFLFWLDFFFLFYPVALRLYMNGFVVRSVVIFFFSFPFLLSEQKTPRLKKKKVAVKRTFCRPARHPKITKSSVGSIKRITMLCFEYKCLCDFFFLVFFPQQDVIGIGRKKMRGTEYTTRLVSHNAIPC